AETGAAELLLRLGAADRAAFDARAGAPQDPRWDLPPASAVRPVPQGAGPVVVMIDPGHGGIDPGAEAGSASEADLMLTFARELREVLLRAGGFEVAMTRDTDSFISLEGRVALAHAAGADVFVSLHADSIDEGIARGAAVYTLAEDASDAASAALAERHDRDDLLAGVDLSGADDRVANVLLDLARLDNTPRSQAMAQHLLDGIRNAVGRVHKRPLRQAGFSVLKAADIPSALIELGFLSTAGELANLQDPAWRAGMAAGIRDGLQAWALEDAALARLRRQ
ncbi:N-acetylmuramoyl-L-alanine amidase family protein, partial [Puniceibacterium confluentis]